MVVESISIHNVTIEETKIKLSQNLQQTFHAIKITSNSLTVSSLEVKNNMNVDIFIIASISATLTEVSFSFNDNSMNNSKEDIYGILSFSSSPLATVLDSIFTSNTGDKFSTGSIYIYNVVQFTIKNCTFTENKSLMQSGGAIGIYYTDGIANIIYKLQIKLLVIGNLKR